MPRRQRLTGFEDRDPRFQPVPEVNTPGEELEIRGMNDFIGAQAQFQTSSSALLGTAGQAGLQEAVSSRRESAGEQFDVAEGVVERRQRGLGVQLSDRQKRAQTRRFSLGRAVAEADVGNRTRRNFRKRALDAAKAGLGIEESLREIETNALTGLSNAAGQEKVRKEQERQAKKSAKTSLITSVLGLGIGLLSLSSEKLKHDKRSTSEDGSLLKRLKNVRVEKWKYLGQNTDHIGPYAEEFNEAFNVGKDHKQMINLADAVGVLMGSVKELDAKVEARG